MQDIEEKGTMEQQLKELQLLNNKLKLATKVAGIGIWEYSLAEEKFIVDDVALSLYNVTAWHTDITFDLWMTFVHPDDKERVCQQILIAFGRYTDFTIEFKIVCLDGTIRHLKSTAFIQRDETGYPTSFLGTTQDITQRIEAEATIKRSEAQYRSFFENSMDGLLLCETDGKILAANPAACDIFRMTEAEICAAGRLGLVDMSDPQVGKMLRERQNTGQSKGEITYRRKDGTLFPGELTSSSFTDAAGNARTSMIIRDITERKTANDNLVTATQTLKHVLKDLNHIMDSSLDIICTIDQQGRFVNMSKAAETILQYKLPELYGQAFLHYVHPDDVEKAKQTAQQIMNGFPVSHFENRYIRKDGSVVPLLWSARWDEKYKLMYCTAKDATEIKKLEKAYEFERKRYYDIFSSAPTGIALLSGPDHKFVVANENYTALIGRKNILGKSVREVLPEVEEQGYIQILNNVYETGVAFQANETLVQLYNTPDGTLNDTYLNFNYIPNTNADGIVEGIFVFANNVTEQVLSRKRLSRHSGNLLAILNTTNIGYVLVDRNVNIIAFNRIANERIESISNSSLQEGKNYLGYFDELHAAFKSEKIQTVLKGETVQTTFQQRLLNGQLRWYSVMINPIIVNNEVDGICFAMQDITVIKEAEIEREAITTDLLQRNKDLEQFNFIVSHNVRSHVANISGLCNVLNTEIAEDENKDIFWNKLCSSVEMLDDVLKDLNLILQIKREITECKEEVFFSKMVAGIRKTMECQIKLSGTVIHTDFSATDSIVSLKSYIYSIFNNLITNSIKYKQPDVPMHISIKAEKEGDKVKLIFSDNGLGIDMNKKGDQVFRLYKRFHHHIEGKGIGLYMVKTQVESLGGRIAIESAVGKGTTFTIHL